MDGDSKVSTVLCQSPKSKAESSTTAAQPPLQDDSESEEEPVHRPFGWMVAVDELEAAQRRAALRRISAKQEQPGALWNPNEGPIALPTETNAEADSGLKKPQDPKGDDVE